MLGFKKAFPGGIHPSDRKAQTQDLPIVEMPAPAKVVLPLLMHVGQMARPKIKVGDEIIAGQKIGDPGGRISAAIHSPISGKVTAAERRLTIAGTMVLSFEITKNNPAAAPSESQLYPALDALSREDLLKIIEENGLVGLGGAAFPTHIKLNPPPAAKVDTLIINGAECEPYLTVDYRLMLEETAQIILGIKAMKKILSVSRVYLGMEDNKPQAVKTMKAALAEENKKDPDFKVEIRVLPTRYPQGAEKQLIQAIADRCVPSGGLPCDCGCVVQNVGTAAVLGEILLTGRPLMSRVVTVAGRVKRPGNYRVAIGTSVADLLAFAGGTDGQPGKVISGGPMMGTAIANLTVPVVKGTTGIIVLSRQEALIPKESPCIRCARCNDVCPIGLQPNYIADLAAIEKFEETERYFPFDCIECACCSYICPTKRHLVEYIKLSKAMLLKQRQKAQAG